MVRDLYVHLRGPVSSVLFVIPFCKQYSIIFQYIIFKISQISKRLLSTDITRFPKIIASNCKKKKLDVQMPHVKLKDVSSFANCTSLYHAFPICKIKVLVSIASFYFNCDRDIQQPICFQSDSVDSYYIFFISIGWFLFYLRLWNRTQFHIPTKENYLDSNQQSVDQEWIIIGMNLVYTHANKHTCLSIFLFYRFFCCFCFVLCFSFVYKISRGGCIQP